MIRWDARFNREFNKIVDNYNAKVRRLRKKGASRLPETISKRELRKTFSGRAATRRELRYQLNELKRFSKRGAEDILILDGSRISRFKVEQGKRRRTRLLRKLAKEIEYQKKFVDPYKPFTKSRLNMLQNIRENLLEDKTVSLDRLREIDIQFSREYDPARVDIFYKEFFKNIKKQADFAKYDKEKFQYIQERLSKLPPDILYKMERTEGRIAFFFDHYKEDKTYNDDDKDSIEANLDSLFEDIDSIIELYLS